MSTRYTPDGRLRLTWRRRRRLNRLAARAVKVDTAVLRARVMDVCRHCGQTIEGGTGRWCAVDGTTFEVCVVAMARQDAAAWHDHWFHEPAKRGTTDG